MPVGVGQQNYKNWSNEFKKLPIDDNTVIVAHSVAPVFVCKFLVEYQIKVKKLIFVCGFNNYLGIDPDFDAVNKPMFMDDCSKVKNCCSEIICYYSDNDPYVSFSKEKEFADAVASTQYVISGGGHLNAESGYTKFEEILKSI